MRYLANKKIGIIGLGNMGGAIVNGLVKSGSVKRNMLFGLDTDLNKCRVAKKRLGISIAGSIKEISSRADIILIAVKPQDINPVLNGLAKGKVLFEEKGKLIISIAAGIKTARIEKALGGRPRVVRVMPNTPAMVGEGISAVCKGRYATAKDVKVTDEIFSSVGETANISEKYFDLVTAVSGSGPAYFFYLKEALIEAAVRLGMDKSMAKKLVSKTAFGAAKLLMVSGYGPEALRQRVTSKGGTTERAMKVFEHSGMKGIVEKAVIAAAKRSRELSEE